MYLESLKADDITVSESALLVDKVSNESREVDILLEGNINGHSVVIGIEVRDHSRPASSEWIEQMHGKHENLKTDKLVLVSGSGFYKPAIAKAKNWGINTVDVSSGILPLRKMLKQVASLDILELRAIAFIQNEALDGESIATIGTKTATINELMSVMLKQQEVQDIAFDYLEEGHSGLKLVVPNIVLKEKVFNTDFPLEVFVT